MRKKNTGFSLVELIVVIAIMAVLVGVTSPMLTGYIEKSRESKDLSNVHSAYSEVMAAATAGDTSGGLYDPVTRTYSKTIELTQSTDGWQRSYPLNIAGVEYSGEDTYAWNGIPTRAGSCKVTYDAASGIQFLWSGLSCNAGSCWYRSGGSGQRAGGYINYVRSGYSSGYASNAVSQMLDGVGGQQVIVSDLSANTTLKKELDQGYAYKIGLFYVDPTDQDASGGSYVLYDTGEGLLPSQGGSYTIGRGSVQEGQDVKVAVQIFKYRTDPQGRPTGRPVSLSSNNEANALANLLSVK